MSLQTRLAALIAAIGADIKTLTTGKLSKGGDAMSGQLEFTGAGVALKFSGTGNRITGDFTNATIANRAMFQTSTTNGASSVGVIPNGTAVVSNFIAWNSADTANASALNFQISSTDARIASTAVGTGSFLPLTFYTNGSESFRCGTDGALTVSKAAGIGYGTGAGGTVTQATNKSIAVTLNKPVGVITTHAASLAAGASVSFSLNNSVIGANDLIFINHGIMGSYRINARVTGAGAASIYIINNSGGALAEAIDISFIIIKGAGT